MTRQTPRLCIGLPVYNGERYLAQAIESLLGQTFADFHLIISDNASSDRTAEICATYARADARVRYHRAEQNHGLSWNFNRVVALADGEYFKWAPYDDVHAPEFVQRCIARLDARPQAVLCGTTTSVIDESGTVVGPCKETDDATMASPAARFTSVLWNWGRAQMLFGVMRLDVLRRTQLHGPYPASDTVLLAELALRGELHLANEPLYFLRVHSEQPTAVCTSDAELAAWFAPANAGRIQLRHWTLFTHYLGTIARVPLPLGERMRCVGAMARWLALKFPTLQDEVRGAVAGSVRRSLGRSARPDARSRAA
jgi:glycosyltransferase involved in cell wall biosynthesis